MYTLKHACPSLRVAVRLRTIQLNNFHTSKANTYRVTQQLSRLSVSSHLRKATLATWLWPKHSPKLNYVHIYVYIH